MLGTEKKRIIEELVRTSSKEELIWINGYLAGLLDQDKPSADAAPAKAAVNKITIAYGTETGNAKKLAGEFAAKAKKKGINAKLVSLDQYRLTDLPKEEYFLTIVSTQGEGEPPAAAKKFYDHIHNNGFKLERLKYSVLALGDTSYPLFCKAGEDVDKQLSKLGGECIVPLQKCDTDYETDAETWFTQVLQQLSSSASHSLTVVAPAPRKSTGKKIYQGSILANINLNDKGSNKQTHHIEIAADGVEYLPGDALGVIPENSSAVVTAIIQTLGVDAASAYHFKHEQASLFDILRKKTNISYLPERVVAKYAEMVGQDIPGTKIGLLDLLKIYPLKDNTQVQPLLDILEPISPRLYSISSSPEAHADEVHVTVGKDCFQVDDVWKNGLCSEYLTALPADTQLEFYIHKNNQFRLPAEDKDIIMIGPGTGIAPFRSFLAHRDATGASGRNWLFFGDQHFVTDFLYQTELLNWFDTGVLTRLNVAFSRDQKEKIYVQHRMMQHSKDLYDWINNGAYLYVCGQKEPMSIDVEDTLIEIIKEEGRKTTDQAVLFLEELKEQGRLLKDVY